jgi:hypothetical protein
MNSCCCYQSVVAGRYRCVKESCVWFDRLEPDMVTDGTGEGGSCACRNQYRVASGFLEQMLDTRRGESGGEQENLWPRGGESN